MAEHPTAKTLVTGSAGFIGRPLIEALKGRGHDVVPTVRRATGPDDVVLDLRGPIPVEAFDGVDRIVHLAGLSDRRAHAPTDFDTVNVAGTMRLAHAAVAAGVHHFIWTSSMFVHGDAAGEPLDVRAAMQPLDDYARSKRDAELALAELAGRMRVTILRLPLVLSGEVARRDRAQRLVRLPVIPVPAPANRRSYIARDSLVRLLVDLVESTGGDSKVLVPEPDGVTGFERVLQAAADEVEAAPRFVPVPRAVFKAIDAVGRRLGRSSLAGIYTDFEVVASEAPLVPPG